MLYRACTSEQDNPPIVSNPLSLLSACVATQNFALARLLLRHQPDFFITAPLRKALWQFSQAHPDEAPLIEKTATDNDLAAQLYALATNNRNANADVGVGDMSPENTFMDFFVNAIVAAERDIDPWRLTEFLCLLNQSLNARARQKNLPPVEANFRSTIYNGVLRRIEYDHRKIDWENIDAETLSCFQALLVGQKTDNPDRDRFLLQVFKTLLRKRLTGLSLDQLFAFVPHTLPNLTYPEQEIYHSFVKRALVTEYAGTTFELSEKHFINPFFVCAVISSREPFNLRMPKLHQLCQLVEDRFLVNPQALLTLFETKMTTLTAEDQLDEALDLLCRSGEKTLAIALIRQQAMPVRFQSTGPFNRILQYPYIASFGDIFIYDMIL